MLSRKHFYAEKQLCSNKGLPFGAVGGPVIMPHRIVRYGHFSSAILITAVLSRTCYDEALLKVPVFRRMQKQVSDNDRSRPVVITDLYHSC